MLLEIDVQGALAVREQFPEALLVFLRAPDAAASRRPGCGAGGPTTPSSWPAGSRRPGTRRRSPDRFDAVVVNDDVERAAGEVAAILAARRTAPPSASP